MFSLVSELALPKSTKRWIRQHSRKKIMFDKEWSRKNKRTGKSKKALLCIGAKMFWVQAWKAYQWNKNLVVADGMNSWNKQRKVCQKEITILPLLYHQVSLIMSFTIELQVERPKSSFKTVPLLPNRENHTYKNKQNRHIYHNRSVEPA